MLRLPRPLSAPRRIPLWAWQLDHWHRTGRKGPRPALAPRKTPGWYWTWRLWHLARTKRKGSAAWKKYRARIREQEKNTLSKRNGAKVAATAKRFAVKFRDMPYTEDARRDDWLQAGHRPPEDPVTDCSGFTTMCSWQHVDLPDPNGLDYKWLGWTGTLWENARKHGTTTTDVSKARPGDDIVIGDYPGVHVVKCVEAGPNPVVESHGLPGVHTQHLSFDPREPKTVLRVL